MSTFPELPLLFESLVCKSLKCFIISFNLGSFLRSPVDSKAYKIHVKIKIVQKKHPFMVEKFLYIWLYTLIKWAMEILSMVSVSSHRNTSNNISSTFAKSWGSTFLKKRFKLSLTIFQSWKNMLLCLYMFFKNYLYSVCHIFGMIFFVWVLLYCETLLSTSIARILLVLQLQRGAYLWQSFEENVLLWTNLDIEK